MSPLAACAPPSGSPLAAPLHARPATCTARLLPALLLVTLVVRRPALPACCFAGSTPPCSARYGFSPCPHWLTRDAATRLAIRNHLPLAECTHFEQHKTAKALDHFLALDPTELIVDLLEQHPSGLLLLVESAAAARARVAGVVEVAAGVEVGAAVEVVEVVEVVAVVGVVAGVGALMAAVVAAVGVAVVAAAGVVAVRVELFRGEVLAVASSSSSSVGARPLHPSSLVSGFLSVGHLGVVLAAQFGDEAERLRWAELLGSGVAIFDLDYDAILAAMYALSVSAEGDRYLCVLPDPGLDAAALGASESALPGTAPAAALHTFTLDSGATCCFFCDSTTLTPLSALVLLKLAYPSWGAVLARSSTVLPCPADLGSSSEKRM
ncbi:unnamed protein product [Closterium sp. NIES-54]